MIKPDDGFAETIFVGDVVLDLFLEIAVFVSLPTELGFVGFQEVAHERLGLKGLQVLLNHERKQEQHQDAEEYAVEDGVSFFHGCWVFWRLIWRLNSR